MQKKRVYVCSVEAAMDVIGVPVKSQSYTLKLINSNGETISNTLRLDSVPVTTSGSPSPT